MKTQFTFAFLFIVFLSYSQIQNENGTLVLESKDTIVGSITYYDDFSSKVIYVDSNNVKNSCTIECINEIILNNGVRYTTIKYDDKADGIVFVQKIISSDLISLYSSDKNGSVFFYIERDGKSYILENNRTITEKKGKRYSSYDYKYLGILKMIMYDKPELYSQIDDLKLTEKDIIDIVLKYNQGIGTYFTTTKKAKEKSISNWVLLGQYSNFANYYYDEPTIATSYGIFAGAQIYFTRSRRSSLKFNLGYSHYELEREVKKEYGIINEEAVYARVYDLQFTFEYIFFMTQRTNIYLNIHIADFSYVNKYVSETNENFDSYVTPIPRLSPGIGIEYTTLERLSFYAELNNLLNFTYLPMNFSVGIKYDIGNITRNKL